MAKLIGLKYYGIDYPKGIDAKIQEVAGHFDIGERRVYGPYCLHTEYSYGRREFRNTNLQGLDVIKKANYQGIPLLWYSDAWTEEFTIYIERLLYNLIPPSIIELHPAFNNYLNLEGFLSRYSIFEKK